MPPEQSTGLGTLIAAESWRPRTGLVTLLFTDTVGSTALKQQLGDQGGAALFRKHHQLVRELLGRFPAGHEIETAGDSFLITFGTPSDAVRFGLLLQASLRQSRETSGVNLLDRIGIHVGEVVVQAGVTEAKPRELYGIQIDTCARVMSLAQGGQILLSRAAFDNARQVLKGEDIEGVGHLEWLNHGPYVLKGLDEPVEICEVREAGRETAGPPATSEKAHRQVSPDSEPVLGWRPALGQIVPNTRWRLEKKLGEGGFGEVWLGRHLTMKERRVFKFCFRADRVRSLKREMTLFRLIKERIGDHPNIVGLREVYFDQPPFYVEMDYVEGQELRSWTEAHGGLGSLPLEVKLEIIAQIADALQAAHDAGVIHRDVKPANILLSNQNPVATGVQTQDAAARATGAGARSRTTGAPLARLTDFGIGQVVSQEHLAGVTRAGFTMTLLGSESSSHTGTQLYMAPELMAGKPATTRSDIYSLGVVLFQLLVEDFTRPLTVDWAGQVREPLLRDDLTRCFSGDLGERYGSASEFSRNLRRFKERQEERQRREAEQAALERRAYRRGMMRMAAVAAVIVLVIAGLAVVARIQSQRAAKTSESLRRHLYCSDMAVAWQSWEDGDVQRTRELLTNQLQALRHREDLQGFEWRYLWARSRPEELFTLPTGCASVKFSPDGQTVAAFGPWSEAKVALWDVASRKLTRSIKAYEKQGWRAAFSPDGQLLATASRGDPDFKLWDPATGRLLATLPATNQENMFVQFSPDGRLLATIACKPYQRTTPAEVKIWDVAARRQFASMPDLKTWCLFADFSPDGETLVVPDGDGYVRLWNFKTGAVRLLKAHAPYATGAKFSPDGKVLATGDQSGTIIVWDWKAGTVLRVLVGHQGPINELVISRDNRLLASASRDHTARLWDLNTGEPLARYLGHPGRVWGLDISPDGQMLATAGEDGVRVWKTLPNREGEVLATTSLNCLVGGSPDGQFVFLDEWATNRVTLWQTASRKVVQTLDGRDIQFCKNGKILTLITGECNVVVYERPTMRTKGSIAGHTNLTGATAISPNGKFLAMRRDHKPVIFDLEKMNEAASLPAGSGDFLAFTPDLKTLVVEEDGGVRLWDVASWRPKRWLCPTNLNVGPIALAGDGGMLAVAKDLTVRLWDLQTGSEAPNPVLGQTASGINSLTFSDDGKNVAAGTFDGMIQIWNVPGRQEIGTFKLHRSVVGLLAFAGDGTLISASYDSSVRLWTAP